MRSAQAEELTELLPGEVLAVTARWGCSGPAGDTGQTARPGRSHGHVAPGAGVIDTPAYGGHQALCTHQRNLAAQVGIMGPSSLGGSTGQDGGGRRPACSQP